MERCVIYEQSLGIEWFDFRNFQCPTSPESQWENQDFHLKRQRGILGKPVRIHHTCRCALIVILLFIFQEDSTMGAKIRDQLRMTRRTFPTVHHESDHLIHQIFKRVGSFRCCWAETAVSDRYCRFLRTWQCLIALKTTKRRLSTTPPTRIPSNTATMINSVR